MRQFLSKRPSSPCLKFIGAYGIRFGLKLLLEISTLKKIVDFSENQNGAFKIAARMNKVERKKKDGKKNGKPLEELHDLKN